MSSVYGERLKLSVFGQSHSRAVGFVLDGIPAGVSIDTEKLRAFMERRRAKGYISTSRTEPDEPEFMSGIKDGYSCGVPISAIIRNTNTKSADYKGLSVTPRPSHGDYTSFCKHGEYADFAGGGHLSGRLTAALCAAGGIAIQYLESMGITIGAHIYSLAGIPDTPFDPVNLDQETLKAAGSAPFPVLNKDAGERMSAAIEEAKRSLDSVGGTVEFGILGVPAGSGSPHFGGLENRLSAAIFGIPAVRGIEFGLGFACAELKGSEMNDPFCYSPEGKVITKTNNSGGINGGMANGMPIVGRVAFRPTASIAAKQDTVDLSAKTNTELKIQGRHDPCIVHRAVPCVEAAAAIAVLDCILSDKT